MWRFVIMMLLADRVGSEITLGVARAEDVGHAQGVVETLLREQRRTQLDAEDDLNVLDIA